MYDKSKYPHLAGWNERKQLGIVNMPCPSCRRRGYKPYLYPDLSVIDASCGKCDHEAGCGYHLTPREFFRDNKDQSADHRTAVEMKPLERIEIPIEAVNRNWRPNDNTLLNYLRTLPLTKEQRQNLEDMARAYVIGTTAEGDTIFWQIDAEGVVRSGKIIKYGDDGHRVKDADGNGRVNWVHSKLQKRGIVGGPDTHQYVGCLFGEHLLRLESKAEVHIVESEKSALIMSIFDNFERRIWMAVGGLGMLNESRLLPLLSAGRKVVVHPDHDGFAKWSDKVQQIGNNKVMVSDWVERLYDKRYDSSNCDVADIAIRRLTAGPSAILDGMIKKNQSIATLVDKLQLTPCQGK